MASQSLTSTQKCRSCGANKPLDSFQNRPDGRDKVCFDCWRRDRQLFQEKEHSKAAASRFRKFSATITKKDSLPHIRKVVGMMLDELGGAEGFVRHWSDQLGEAMQRNPGSKTVLDALSGLAKMIGALTQDETDVDFSGMANKQVVEFMMEALVEEVLSDPSLAKQVAEAAGLDGNQS